jgi:hypothetical protein
MSDGRSMSDGIHSPSKSALLWLRVERLLLGRPRSRQRSVLARPNDSFWCSPCPPHAPARVRGAAGHALPVPSGRRPIRAQLTMICLRSPSKGDNGKRSAIWMDLIQLHVKGSPPSLRPNIPSCRDGKRNPELGGGQSPRLRIALVVPIIPLPPPSSVHPRPDGLTCTTPPRKCPPPVVTPADTPRRLPSPRPPPRRTT